MEDWEQKPSQFGISVANQSFQHFQVEKSFRKYGRIWIF